MVKPLVLDHCLLPDPALPITCTNAATVAQSAGSPRWDLAYWDRELVGIYFPVNCQVLLDSNIWQRTHSPNNEMYKTTSGASERFRPVCQLARLVVQSHSGKDHTSQTRPRRRRSTTPYRSAIKDSSAVRVETKGSPLQSPTEGQ